jgi:hypothetical protein
MIGKGELAVRDQESVIDRCVENNDAGQADAQAA